MELKCREEGGNLKTAESEKVPYNGKEDVKQTFPCPRNTPRGLLSSTNGAGVLRAVPKSLTDPCAPAIWPRGAAFAAAASRRSASPAAAPPAPHRRGQPRPPLRGVRRGPPRPFAWEQPPAGARRRAASSAEPGGCPAAAATPGAHTSGPRPRAGAPAAPPPQPAAPVPLPAAGSGSRSRAESSPRFASARERSGRRGRWLPALARSLAHAMLGQRGSARRVFTHIRVREERRKKKKKKVSFKPEQKTFNMKSHSRNRHRPYYHQY
ncbi:atherin-like [Falco cherrug]|uniref:atherin-like n=1 Tax=Falco cherrug TaxID=345164 RepID=UPI00247A84F3|nr:atherin-like [Falco cherrug]